jgi:protein gp37
MADFWHEAVPLEWLNEALDVIEATPLLHYLLLSKRPGNINRKLAELNRKLPANVWAGATIGHPKSLPLLKPLGRVNASIRFLSVEPLLAPMVPGLDRAGIDWVICGGESGHNPRPCNPEWVRSVRDLCIAHGTPFFFKQWGGTNKKAAGRVLDGRTWDEFPPYS